MGIYFYSYFFSIKYLYKFCLTLQNSNNILVGEEEKTDVKYLIRLIKYLTLRLLKEKYHSRVLNLIGCVANGRLVSWEGTIPCNFYSLRFLIKAYKMAISYLYCLKTWRSINIHNLKITDLIACEYFTEPFASSVIYYRLCLDVNCHKVKQHP